MPQSLDLSKFKTSSEPSLDLSKFGQQEPDLSIPDDISNENIPEEQPKSGWLSKAWHFATDPLTDAPSRFADSINKYVGSGKYYIGSNESPLSAFGSGALQGLGDVASSFTSPLNLATLAASGGASLAGKMALSEVAEALHYATKGLSAPIAAHGAYEVVRPDASMSQRGFGLAELAGGMAGMKSHMPEVASSLVDRGAEMKSPVFDDPAGMNWVNEELNKLRAGKYNQDVRPPGPWDENAGVNTETKTPGMTDDQLYDMARKRQGMGEELPVEEIRNSGPIKEDFDPSKLNFEDTLKSSLKDRMNKVTGEESPEPQLDLSAFQKMEAAGEFSGDRTTGSFEAPAGSLEDVPNMPKGTAEGVSNDMAEFNEAPTGKVGAEEPISEIADAEGLKTQTGQPPNKPPTGPLDFEQLDPEIPVTRRKAPEYKEPGKINKALDTFKNLMSVDLPFVTSAAFRQTRPLSFTKAWFEAWGKAAKAFGSQAANDSINAAIHEGKYFKPKYQPIYNSKGELVRYSEMPSYAEKIGLKLMDKGRLDEQLGHGFAEQALGPYSKYIRASNRSYTTFTNHVLAETATKLLNQLESSGNRNNMVMAREIAKFVNDGVGRGELRLDTGNKKLNSTLNFEQSAKKIGNVLWSPRNLSSRVAFFNPATYMQASPAMKKQYFYGLTRVLASWGAFSKLAQFAGAKVSGDPTNSDFGKVKIGNTRIDPSGGYGPIAVLLARYGMGEKTSSSFGNKVSQLGEGYKPETTTSLVGDYLYNQLPPAQRFAFDLLNASSKTPLHVNDRLVQSVLPFYATDIMQLASKDPSLAAIVGLSSSVGFGGQTYGSGKDFGKSVLLPEKYDFDITNPHPGKAIKKMFSLGR